MNKYHILLLNIGLLTATINLVAMEQSVPEQAIVATQMTNEEYKLLGTDIWKHILSSLIDPKAPSYKEPWYIPYSLKSIPLISKYFAHLDVASWFIENRPKAFPRIDREITKLHIAAGIGANGWMEQWFRAHRKNVPCDNIKCCNSKDCTPSNRLYMPDNNANTPLANAIINGKKRTAQRLFGIAHNIHKTGRLLNTKREENDNYLKNIITLMSDPTCCDDETFKNLMCWAIEKEYYKIIAFLSSIKPDEPYGNEESHYLNLLHEAIKNDDTAVVRQCLTRVDLTKKEILEDNNLSPLKIAVLYNANIEIIRLLCNASQQADVNDILSYFCFYNSYRNEVKRILAAKSQTVSIDDLSHSVDQLKLQ